MKRRDYRERIEEEHKLETFGRIPNFSVCCAKANGRGPFHIIPQYFSAPCDSWLLLCSRHFHPSLQRKKFVPDRNRMTWERRKSIHERVSREKAVEIDQRTQGTHATNVHVRWSQRTFRSAGHLQPIPFTNFNKTEWECCLWRKDKVSSSAASNTWKWLRSWQRTTALTIFIKFCTFQGELPKSVVFPRQTALHYWSFGRTCKGIEKSSDDKRRETVMVHKLLIPAEIK